MARPFIVMLLVLGACTSAGVADTAAPTTMTTPPPTTTAVPPTTTSTTTSTTTTTTVPTVVMDGEVTAPDGTPLAGAVITSSITTTTSNDVGAFTIELLVDDEVTVSYRGLVDRSFAWTPDTESVDVRLDAVRALRVSRYVSMDAEMFAGHLDMAANSTINALIFDTKDETGQVLYDTSVGYAHDIGAVEVVYDPVDLLAQAKSQGLYTATRIVSFEDPLRVRADPETKLRGAWVDMANPAVWEYPLELATEACALGFDEIQFDYVRFPAGLTGAALAGTFTAAERIETITSFLTEAGSRLHPMGCVVSADVFGIVFSSPTDEGVGQRVEELSAVVDVISPMIYPSHYSNGWLGFADPNDHPGPVVADALDAAADRVAPSAIVRPWLQAFYYVPSQILTEIGETEARGLGWMLWNAGGNYSPDALPPEPTP